MTPTVRWRTYASTGRDHLLMPKDQYGGHEMTWCGIAVDTVGHENGVRCKQCVTAITRFAAQAVEPPPEMITESVVVTVIRPAGGSESAAVAIRRRMQAMKTWKVTVE